MRVNSNRSAAFAWLPANKQKMDARAARTAERPIAFRNVAGPRTVILRTFNSRWCEMATGITEETVGWVTRRREYPLPAQRGERQGEGCLEPVEVVFVQRLQGVPSPRPSPHSFVAGRGRRHSAEAALVILSINLRTAQYGAASAASRRAGKLIQKAQG